MRHRWARLLVCGAMAGSASLAAVIVPGSVAGAAQLTVSCTVLTGNTVTQTTSGCTGSDVAQTGSHGTITPHVNTKTHKGTATIVWATGKTTTETTSYVLGVASTCPTKTGYIKLAKAITTSTVTSGSANKLIGATKFTATSCEYAKAGIHIFNIGKVTY